MTHPLSLLRTWMQQHAVEAFIVPTADPHASEYLAPHHQTRQWLTAFTGSAGTAVVAMRRAALWTDSRYFLQAADELPDDICLMREGEPDTPTIDAWLTAEGVATVGYDPAVTTAADLPEQSSVRYVATADPFAEIWRDRPALPCRPVGIMPEAIAGEAVADKLRRLRQWLTERGGHTFLTGELSEVAWLTNLRGSDIDYNPYFYAFIAVSPTAATLYTDARHFAPEVTAYLAAEGISVRPYADIQQPIDGVTHMAATLPLSLTQRYPEAALVSSPLTAWKAVKNAVEQDGFREAMRQDGVAMVRWLAWLQREVVGSDAATHHSELSVSDALLRLREQQPDFVGLSFPTISAYAHHAAIVHYEPTPATDLPLQPHGLLLVDSGAHYRCGTTDITRTIALGPVTAEERRAYTAVLRAHIGVQMLRFPLGTTGLQIDMAARIPLWQQGYDYGHGTGHGVGHYLGVHEGPHQIRKQQRGCTLVPFRPGYVVTDEPGVYIAGHFGIRIENVVLTSQPAADAPSANLYFEPLTLCPYDLSAADLLSLTTAERDWLNAYHRTVRATLLPRLTDEAEREWLIAATQEV